MQSICENLPEIILNPLQNPGLVTGVSIMQCKSAAVFPKVKEMDDYNARFGKIIEEEEDKENEMDDANNEIPV